jgi:hypothetical protein
MPTNLSEAALSLPHDHPTAAISILDTAILILLPPIFALFAVAACVHSGQFSLDAFLSVFKEAAAMNL